MSSYLSKLMPDNWPAKSSASSFSSRGWRADHDSSTSTTSGVSAREARPKPRYIVIITSSWRESRKNTWIGRVARSTSAIGAIRLGRIESVPSRIGFLSIIVSVTWWPALVEVAVIAPIVAKRTILSSVNTAVLWKTLEALIFTENQNDKWLTGHRPVAVHIDHSSILGDHSRDRRANRVYHHIHAWSEKLKTLR